MYYQGNVCLQHIILDFANGTTVRELLALSHHFGNCDHQNAFSENRKDESHLVARFHTAREQHFGLGVSRTSAEQHSLRSVSLNNTSSFCELSVKTKVTVKITCFKAFMKVTFSKYKFL